MPEHASMYHVPPKLIEKIEAARSIRELFTDRAMLSEGESSDVELLKYWEDINPEEYDEILEILGIDLDLFLEVAKKNQALDLITSWPVLHYVFSLTNTKKPDFKLFDSSGSELRVNAICGGREINGHESDRYFEPSEVKALSRKLECFSEAMMSERITQSQEISLVEDFRNLSVEERERITRHPKPIAVIQFSDICYFLRMCNEVKQLYSQAASNGLAIMICFE